MTRCKNGGRCGCDPCACHLRDDDTGIVISLATGQPIEADPSPGAKRGGFCMHRGWIVDERSRTLTCQECGNDVDPFEALSGIAREYDSVRRAQTELKKLREHMERLHQEEARVKARTKNASRRDAAAAVEAERAKWATRLYRTANNAREIERAARKIRRACGDVSGSPDDMYVPAKSGGGS